MIHPKGSEPLIAAYLDVEPLDQGLFRLLEPLLQALFRDLPSSLNRYAKDFALPFINLVTVIATNGQTPSTQILRLELVDGTKHVDSHSSRVVLCGVISALLPALRDPILKWMKIKMEAGLEECDTEASNMARIAHARQRAMFTLIHNIITRILPLARLCCLLACWKGISTTINVPMLLMGLTFQPKDQQEQRLHVDFAHRRWIQQEATSTAKIFLAGLMMVSSWKPLVQNFLVKTLARFAYRTSPSQVVTPTQCPVCNKEINVPLLLSCGHMSCYTCFYAELNNVNRVSCRICRKWTDESRAVIGVKMD